MSICPGYSLGGKLGIAGVPLSLGVNVRLSYCRVEINFVLLTNQGKKDVRELDLGERMPDDPLNINAEEYSKVRVSTDTNQNAKLVLVKIFKVGARIELNLELSK